MKKNNDVQVPRLCLENHGERLQKLGNAINVINKLLHENQIIRDHEDGEGSFNGYVCGGLFNAIELLVRHISETGEVLTELAESEQ